MAPRVNVSPAASATATTQPHQAGTRVIPQDLARTLSNVVNTLREATALSINPRIRPDVAAMLSQQNLSLQTSANQISDRLDALAPNSDARLSVYNDLNLLGGQVQDYVQAVINALNNVGEGPRASGSSGVSIRLGALSPEEQEAKSKRTWIIVGTVSVTLLAGLGIYLASRKTKAQKAFGKIKGAMSAR